MSAAPFMQLYVADYLGDTQHLTAEEHGAYLLLLMAMWRAGGTLPLDPHKLCRISRVHPPRWARIWATIREFFTEDETGISQKRLLKELGHAKAVSAARSEAGKEGARVRHDRQSRHTESSVKTGTYTDTKTDLKPLKDNYAPVANAAPLPRHSQIPDTREDTRSTTEARAREPDQFPAFWAKYPNKTGKPKAHAAYRSALKRATADEIAAGLARYIASKPEDRQWLNPATFLNQDRWADEPAIVDRPSTGPPRNGRQGTVGDMIRESIQRLQASQSPPHDPEPLQLTARRVS